MSKLNLGLVSCGEADARRLADILCWSGAGTLWAVAAVLLFLSATMGDGDLRATATGFLALSVASVGVAWVGLW